MKGINPRWRDDKVSRGSRCDKKPGKWTVLFVRKFVMFDPLVANTGTSNANYEVRQVETNFYSCLVSVQLQYVRNSPKNSIANTKIHPTAVGGKRITKQSNVNIAFTAT